MDILIQFAVIIVVGLVIGLIITFSSKEEWRVIRGKCPTCERPWDDVAENAPCPLCGTIKPKRDDGI